MGAVAKVPPVPDSSFARAVVDYEETGLNAKRKKGFDCYLLTCYLMLSICLLMCGVTSFAGGAVAPSVGDSLLSYRVIVMFPLLVISSFLFLCGGTWLWVEIGKHTTTHGKVP